MTRQTLENLAGRLAQKLGEASRRSGQVHDQFLQQRASSLRQIQKLIEQQMGSVPEAPASPALFSSAQLDEFGTGLVSRCFGPAFAHYDTRQIPRIPNGALKMMSRVTGIRGSLDDPRQPADVEVEYDVPADAWYQRDSGGYDLPYSLLMEIALQPCGFLSAYLDSYVLVPQERIFFRNLDGSARVVESLADARGRTLTTHARLLISTASAGTAIQKYQFTVSSAGQVIYQGESTFGYFSSETMANQVGLDKGQPVQPWARLQPGIPAETFDLQPWRSGGSPRLSTGRLGFLDQVSLIRGGGNLGNGYVYARRPVDPRDWFFPYHFYGDPVMPGSLGIEAVLEALKASALALGLGSELRAPRFTIPAGAQPMSWRYRGQVTPQHKMMELEIHLGAPERIAQGVSLAGNASVWIDGLRIYEVKNVSVCMIETDR